MIEAMSQIVFLTCHPEMGRRRDRPILRDNQAWAAQIVDHYRSHPHPSGTRFFHQTAEPAGRGEAGVRAGTITAFGAAATAAGPEGTIMLRTQSGLRTATSGTDARLPIGITPRLATRSRRWSSSRTQFVAALTDSISGHATPGADSA